ncbi:MAG TPA: redoxin domain-containing protein [Candidatus Saccharimonadales bacterium]|nr:redoxin domain-containing protein [Candidatus Saccharimonadales bacterium]
MANQKTTSGKFWIAVLAIFSGLATIQIIFLTMQNRELKTAIGVANAGKRIDGLKPGDNLPAFNGINAGGTETRVSYDEGDHLLFITSTKCPWCEKTVPTWKEIAETVKGKSVQAISISIDGKGEIESYIKNRGLNFDVLNFPDASLLQAYKAFSTPQTILVKQGGRVEKVWMGMLSETTKKEILEQLQ